MKKNNPLVLRMDDVGASSKKYNVYSKSRIGNFLFLKKLNLSKLGVLMMKFQLNNGKK